MTSMQRYCVENYEDYFVIGSEAYEDSLEEKIENLRDKLIGKYRKVTIKSGDILEVEIYPLGANKGGKRGRKKQESRTVQANLNNKNAVKYLIRLLNTNFTDKDLTLTLTYSNEHLPANPEQAKKDMENYLRRIKRSMKKEQPGEKLKYVYVTEYEYDEEKGKKRIHHHLVMNFRNREIAKEKWNGRGRVSAEELEPNHFGLEGLARYLAKDKKNKNKNGTKSYTPSRNLKKPTITIADSKVTRRRVEKLATGELEAQDYFEKLYKGYQFNDMEVKYSDFVNGAYLYVRMKRIDNPVQTKRRLNV
ncbi:hypothetical protein QIX46_19650 [Lysinibacillus boronitolerans]|nr:hypothetical protein QIX46_19650 [Lysinibacillus boronitolerans]